MATTVVMEMREEENGSSLVNKRVAYSGVSDDPDNLATLYLVPVQQHNHGLRRGKGERLRRGKGERLRRGKGELTNTSSVAIPPLPTTTILRASSNFLWKSCEEEMKQNQLSQKSFPLLISIVTKKQVIPRSPLTYLHTLCVSNTNHSGVPLSY